MQGYRYTQNSFHNGEIDPKSRGFIGTSFIKSALAVSNGFLPFPSGGIMRTQGTFLSHADKESTGGMCRQVVLKVEGQQNEYNSAGEKTFGNESYIIKIYAGKISAILYDGKGTDNIVQGKVYNNGVTLAVGTVLNPYSENEIEDLSIASNKGKLYIAHRNHKLIVVSVNLELTTSTFIKLEIAELVTTGVNFNTPKNYAGVVAFNSGRMVLASTLNKPNTLWMSRTPDVMSQNLLTDNEGTTSVSEIEMDDRYTDFTLYDYSITETTVSKSVGLSDETDTKEVTLIKTTYSNVETETSITKKEIYIYTRVETSDGVKTTTINKVTITKSSTTESDIDNNVDLITLEQDITAEEGDEKTQNFIYSELPSLSISLPAYGDPTVETERSIDKILFSSHAIEVQESDLSGSNIKWIANAGRMAVATDDAIFINDGAIPTPQTFDLSLSSYQSSGLAKAKTIRNYILFTGKNDKTLYFAYYNYQIEGFSVQELTATARHILIDGVRDFTITFEPFPIIWVITKTGKLCSCAINFSENGVMPAWSTQETAEGREYLSLCVAGKFYDTLSLYVKTTKDGEEDRYDFETLRIKEEEYQESCIFTDRTEIITYDTWNVNQTTIPVTNFNTGDVVQVMANNYYIGEFTVNNTFINIGIINIGNVFVKFRIGLKKPAYISFFDPILSSNGISLITKHSITKLYLKLYKSGVATILDGEESSEMFNEEFGESLFGSPYQLTTGDIEIFAPTTINSNEYLKINVEKPFPFNLLAISYKYNITED